MNGTDKNHYNDCMKIIIVCFFFIISFDDDVNDDDNNDDIGQGQFNNIIQSIVDN